MKDYQYFELAQKQIDQYVIQPGDEMSVKVFTRDGFRLVDVIGNVNGGGGGGSSIQSASSFVTYPVDNEGFVRLPIVGEMFVKGYTEKELQRILADKYSGLFVEPFVIVRVENRRAFVFKGSGASVVALNFAPTNLLEVIAKSGGLDQALKAYNIKVIRGDIKNPQVILIDLSTLEGMRKADLIVQSNDIIYIEQKRTNIATLILSEFTPYLGLVTTVTTVILLAKAFGK
ncbi:MAG: polysaccharide export protein Wza [Bacteroidota bacterium]|nr:polysaccharide export protein Wza [Bacteroidota bacterium]